MKNIYQYLTIRRLTNLLKRELACFPQAKLTDFYKLLYQDYFGPGHYINDQQKIIHYLKDELKKYEMTDRAELSVRSLAGLNDFLRIDLIWLKNGYVTAAGMAELFAESANLSLYQPLSWHQHWQNMIILLKVLGVKIDSFELNNLQKWAEQDQDVHHSKLYRHLYKPHYRLIDRRLWINFLRHISA
jgi:hypothetical protein